MAYSGVVYSRSLVGEEQSFGVSGMLYRSNVLMYDRKTESLWSQVRGEAVAGPLAGTELKVLPSTLTSWGKWRKKYPQTQVLSLDTGHTRNYEQDPYLDYYAQQSGFRSFFKLGPGEKEKELVLGVEINGQTKAYPLQHVRDQKTMSDDSFAGGLTLTFDPQSDQLSVQNSSGEAVEYMIVYWFVWKGIWPDTGRY